MKKRSLKNGPRVFNHIAKYYQFPVFYEREINLWYENSYFRGKRLHDFLNDNRKKYAGKSLDELTDLQIMRAMTISGVIKGHSVFDTRGMDSFCKKYDIKSIYDPCSGWGERALYSHVNGISYIGVDINTSLFKGYEEMTKDLGLEVSFINADSSFVYFDDVICDTVFTCPPYFDTEIYSYDGIENYPYDEFLNWWDRVVKASLSVNPTYFAFQINQKYKEDMCHIVLKNGFQFLEEMKLDGPKSHLCKTKKEYESIVVFKKVF